MESLYGAWNKISSALGYVDASGQQIGQLEPCPNCKEPLTEKKDPRVLVCNHMYCYSCLASLEYSQTIKCPLCKRVTILEQPRGIMGLSKYHSSVVTQHHTHVNSHTKTDNQEKENVKERPQKTLSRGFEDIPLDNNVNEEEEVTLESQVHEQQVEEETKASGDEEEQYGEFVVLNNKPRKITVKYYLPFTQKKEVCKPLLDQWLASAWFAPYDLHEVIEYQPFRPVYIPFYCFRVETKATFTVELGTKSDNGEVVWRVYSGETTNRYEELMTSASRSVDKKLLDDLLAKKGSFSVSKDRILPPEKPNYKGPSQIDNIQVFPVDIGMEQAYINCGKEKVKNGDITACKEKLKRENANIAYKQNFQCNTEFSKRDYFVILLPVFLGGFTYNGKHYETIISGNRGEVVGDRPMGSGRIGKYCRDAVQSISTYIVGDSYSS